MGPRLIAVDTPFLFADGEPISFYLDENVNAVVVSDNANTLAHLASIGFDITDRRGWKSVGNIVSSFGFDLLDSGEIVGKGIIGQEQELVTKYISAMLAVVDWECDYLAASSEVNEYLQEVEMYLRAWKPDATLLHSPVVQGHSGRPHYFHYEFDKKLIDAARPHSSRTGSILRKAADVINSGVKREIVVILDDREDSERAKVETDILSTMVSVLPITRLANLGSRLPLH